MCGVWVVWVQGRGYSGRTKSPERSSGLTAKHTGKHERLVYKIHDLCEHNGHCFGDLAYRKLVRKVRAAGLGSVDCGANTRCKIVTILEPGTVSGLCGETHSRSRWSGRCRDCDRKQRRVSFETHDKALGGVRRHAAYRTTRSRWRRRRLVDMREIPSYCGQKQNHVSTGKASSCSGNGCTVGWR